VFDVEAMRVYKGIKSQTDIDAVQKLKKYYVFIHKVLIYKLVSWSENSKTSVILQFESF